MNSVILQRIPAHNTNHRIFQQQTKQAFAQRAKSMQALVQNHDRGRPMDMQLVRQIYKDGLHASRAMNDEAMAKAITPRPSTLKAAAAAVGHRGWLVAKGVGRITYGVALAGLSGTASLFGMFPMVHALDQAMYGQFEAAEISLRRSVATATDSIYLKRFHQWRNLVNDGFKLYPELGDAYYAAARNIEKNVAEYKAHQQHAAPHRAAALAALQGEQAPGRVSADEWFNLAPPSPRMPQLDLPLAPVARAASPAPSGVSSIVTDATGLSRTSSVSDADSLYARG